MTSPNRRRETDLMKLMMGNFEVNTVSDGLEEFYVLLHGPAGSPYEGGVWKLKVELAEDYPFSPPWIVFTNKIYHPNVNEVGGAICLDVIKHCWSPMFDMVNVFDQFLPQLLLYPNPEDPLNKDAAALMMSDPALYDAKVREYCDKYAKPEDVGAAVPPKEPSDEEITEDEHDSSDDGPVDPLAGPSMTKTEHDSSDKPDAGPVDAPSKTEDELGSSNVNPQTETEHDSSDKPDAGPVDAPSMTEDEHGSSKEPKPDALLSLTETLSLE